MAEEKMTSEQIREHVEDLVARSRKAQKIFERTFTTNHRVDEVLRAIGKAFCDNALELAGDAMKETGYGNLEDKLSKLTSAALIEWAQCKGKNTIEPYDSPTEPGVQIIPKPMGVISATMPSTNPVATIIGNAMMVLKGRNSIIIASHPASVNVSERSVELLRNALKEVGAPEDLILGISKEAASMEATGYLMTLCDCNLATGGKGMVKAVYSSGKPGIGVGQGNCQELIDDDQTAEDLKRIVPEVIGARNMDNGVPCACTQTDHVPEKLEDDYLRLMKENKAYIVNEEEKAKIRDLVFPNGETRINRDVVGRMPHDIGKMAGIDIPEGTPIILIKSQAWGDMDRLDGEILCPILRYTTYEKFEDAVDRAVMNLEYEGAGHTSCIQSRNEDHIKYAAMRVPTCRFHINQPTTGSADNGLDLSLTIGCGTWGGTSVPENICYYHLIQRTKVTRKLPNIHHFWDVDWDDFTPFEKLIPEA